MTEHRTLPPTSSPRTGPGAEPRAADDRSGVGADGTGNPGEGEAAGATPRAPKLASGRVKSVASTPAPALATPTTSGEALTEPVSAATCEERSTDPGPSLPTSPSAEGVAPVPTSASPAFEGTKAVSTDVDTARPEPASRIPVAESALVARATARTVSPPVAAEPTAQAASAESFILIRESDASAATKSGSRAPRRKGNRHRTPAVTPRDHEILAFLARYRYATYKQIARRFGMNWVEIARRRVVHMWELGLAEKGPLPAARVHVCRVTDDGATVSGCALPALTGRPALGTMKHVLNLTSIGTEFELCGETVRTEAEIRATDGVAYVTRESALQGCDRPRVTENPQYAIRNGSGLHYPDMVLERDPIDGNAQSIAIELELNRKAPKTLQEILKSYVNAPNIASVVYFVDDEKVANNIHRCAAAVGATEMVEVRFWESIEELHAGKWKTRR